MKPSPSRAQIETVIDSVLECACANGGRRGFHQDRADGFHAGWVSWFEPEYISKRKPGAIKAYRLGMRVGHWVRTCEKAWIFGKGVAR